MVGYIGQMLFYRPVILYTAGKIGFINMMLSMIVRITILTILASAAALSVAYDEGVFQQDGSRPDPAIADKARRDAEAAAYFANRK